MRSQSSFASQTIKSVSSLTLSTNPINNKKQPKQYLHQSTTPTGQHYTLPAPVIAAKTLQSPQMTTGGGISGNNTNAVTAQPNSSSTASTLSSCNTTASSSSSINTLSKASTILSTTRHSSGNLSMNNNSTTAINNNNNNSSKTLCTNNNNNNNNEGKNNQNPNWSKLQTLEQRKLELEKLLNEKNWLLQQIHKQEAQILNGNYESFNLFETGKVLDTNINTTCSSTDNSILRRKGSSSLKLSKSNVHFNGKANRLTLSKSEYDLAQENNFINQQSTSTTAIPTSVKKRQGPPLKTNSFHDSTPASALSLTKSPSFEYNGSTGSSQIAGALISSSGSNSSNNIKYPIVCPHNESNGNLTSALGITQCDKYYLSPTSQMYSDGSGFIKASQNIKQCLSPSPMHRMVVLNDSDGHRTKQQQLHPTNGHKMVHHNGNQSHLEQYECVDSLSLSPPINCTYDLGQHVVNQHSNLWRTMSNSDRSGWCDSTSYIELDSDDGNPYHNVKPKKTQPTSITVSSMPQSPDSPAQTRYYPVGGSYMNPIDKASDEISISSVNSETSKKPKNKQWMESSLDGPAIRPNILQSTPSTTDAISICPALSPNLNQNPQYTYYNYQSRQALSSSATDGSGKFTTVPTSIGTVSGGAVLIPVINSRPQTRTLIHHSHPHHKPGYRERTKLSSQSMSSGSYRAPKAKLEEDNNHLSHSTSYLNVDPYHHHHFHIQPTQQKQQQQPQHMPTYPHNHYHTDNSFTMPHVQQLLQQQQIEHQQKQSKSSPSSTLQQTTPLPKFSPIIQQKPCAVSSINGEDFAGTIRYATSVATQPSRLCNPNQAITKNTMQLQLPTNLLHMNSDPQLSPQTSAATATSPDIRIESPKNMTVVQQATFLPYKEVTKPFEMSDFYKYSTKFRQKDTNTALSKNPT